MTETPGKNILVVLPAYNEAGKIGRVVEKTKAVSLVDAVVAVDDCSTDSTSEEARAAGAIVIRHEKNRGVGAAIRTGIKYGLQNHFNICAILSGDDQHEPGEIERVVGPIVNNEYDFIQGSRRIKGGRVVNDRPFRMITTQLYSLLFSILTRRRITDATNGFRAFRLAIFDRLGINIDQDWLDRYELEPYLLYKAAKDNRIRIKEVPITIYYRGGRREFTKMKPFRDWWRLAKPLIFLTLRLRK
jgi:dolichol-phosphate mannosyltransferase